VAEPWRAYVEIGRRSLAFDDALCKRLASFPLDTKVADVMTPDDLQDLWVEHVGFGRPPQFVRLNDPPIRTDTRLQPCGYRDPDGYRGKAEWGSKSSRGHAGADRAAGSRIFAKNGIGGQAHVGSSREIWSPAKADTGEAPSREPREAAA
jgi:hypothetical protein